MIRACTDTNTAMIIIMHTGVDTSMSMLRKIGLRARGRIALRDLAHRTRGESRGRDGELPATMRPRTWI